MQNKLFFSSDYMEGAHPKIIKRLVDTNMEHTSGYGTDEYCETAKNKIREECCCPQAEVEFLVGGTQTNSTVIDAMLRQYQGAIAIMSGHIGCHEAGAIESCGHKVITLNGKDGKLEAQTIDKYLNDFYADENCDHMVQPGMVYISQATETGTIYSLNELTAISEVCHNHNIYFYVDGARLAYALACSENDVTLPDLARLCDAFYIGGTKCGTLFGEAVVIPNKNLIPHFFTIIKQHGALFAKGRLLGIQFDTLFTDGLYYEVGENAIKCADRIRKVLDEYNYKFATRNPTNQIFIVLENNKYKMLSSQIEFGFWEKFDDTHTVVRIATSWATTESDVDKLIELLKQ